MREAGKPTVAVLMSTYNGENYISEQIESILSQKDVNIKLYIRDDGSEDKTLSILKQYSVLDNVKLVVDGENIGPGNSFMRLLYTYAGLEGVEFFAFSDQDDIWFSDKIAIAIETLGDSGQAKLYCSNQNIFKNGVDCGLRYTEPQDISLIGHITKNTIAGCTFVFTKKLANIIAESRHVDEELLRYRLHDAWVILVAICCGIVFYDEKSYMRYRIHSANVVGIKKENTLAKLKKLGRLINQGRKDRNIRMRTAEQLLYCLSGISGNSKVKLCTIANYQSSFLEKWKLFSDKDIIENCGENSWIFRLKVLMNFL